MARTEPTITDEQYAWVLRLERKIEATRKAAEANRKVAEGKLNDLTVKVDAIGGTVDALTHRVDNMGLNGRTPALIRLADSAEHLVTLAANADQLSKLAMVAPLVTDAVQRDQEWAIFRKVLFRIVNPLKPVGAVMWLILTAVVIAVVNSRIH